MTIGSIGWRGDSGGLLGGFVLQGSSGTRTDGLVRTPSTQLNFYQAHTSERRNR